MYAVPENSSVFNYTSEYPFTESLQNNQAPVPRVAPESLNLSPVADARPLANDD